MTRLLSILTISIFTISILTIIVATGRLRRGLLPVHAADL
jgi:hypothetical protein